MRFAIAAAALAAAGPAGADALQDRVLAGIKATDTRDVGFVRTVRMERTGSGAQEFTTRYDPRAIPPWSVLKVDGRAPTAKEAADIVKSSAKSPPQAYARLARWFGGAAVRIADAPGQVTYRFTGLPADTMTIGSHDASADTVADAVVNTSGPRPFVERVRFSSARAFRMMLVAKVERFAITASYAPMPDGRLFPSGTDSEIAGSMMGKAGSIRTRSRYSEVHGTR